MDFLALVERGGGVMYLLLLCSILVLTILFQKLYFLYAIKKEFFSLSQKALESAKKGDTHLEQNSSYSEIGAVINTVLGKSSNKEVWEERIARKLREIRRFLSSYLWVLATISSVAPFIGLYGTVVGIIKSFDSIAMEGKGGFSVVAEGLSEALVATAAGIFVAVFSVICYNYFQNRLSSLNLGIRSRVEEIKNIMEENATN